MAENNVYKELRTRADLSQDDVSDDIPRNALSSFENGNKTPSSEDIVCMSRAYKSKRLCHWYCAKECPVGKEIKLLQIDPLKTEDFGQVMMTIHSAIRHLKNLNLDELIDISMDGKIEELEKETYMSIKESLADLARAYGALLRIEEDDIEGKVIFKDNYKEQ